ncbi:MAG: hypothetical protein VZT48_05705 [Bulleidia sp.]|nr:hypothetical protein [Bulleidia sp.]
MDDIGKLYRHYFHLKQAMGYLSGHTKNEKNIRAMLDEAGFFVIITSEKMSAERALDIYKNKDASEKLFRMLKSELGFDKAAVYTDEAVKTKTHLVFLAAIVRTKLYQALKPVIDESNDRKNYTVNAAIHAIENIEITRNSHGKYMHDYALTKRQKKVLGAVGLTEKDVRKTCMKVNKDGLGRLLAES